MTRVQMFDKAAYMREWRRKNPEKNKEYRGKNREKIAATMREYRRKNREKKKETRDENRTNNL